MGHSCEDLCEDTAEPVLAVTAYAKWLRHPSVQEIKTVKNLSSLRGNTIIVHPQHWSTGNTHGDRQMGH